MLHAAAAQCFLKFVDQINALLLFGRQRFGRLRRVQREGNARQRAVGLALGRRLAQQMAQQKASSAPSLSEALGSVQAPEAQSTKKGGSTFDTLNGNVLSR